MSIHSDVAIPNNVVYKSGFYIIYSISILIIQHQIQIFGLSRKKSTLNSECELQKNNCYVSI